MDCEKIFIIGDIHGCLETFERMMDKIDWRPDRDALIFLGDYIDRGKDSKGVIDAISKIVKASPHVHCLSGNHENLFLDYLAGVDIGTFFMNGGDATLESYRRNGIGEIPPDHISFLENLEPWIELDDYYVVHAGLRPGVAVEKQSLDDLLWIREPFIYSDYDFGKRVIFGHTPFDEPLVAQNKIGIDTGAVYGNKLTCLELPVLRFHSVGV